MSIDDYSTKRISEIKKASKCLPLKSYGILIALFSSPPGHEPVFADEHISDFLETYKEKLKSVSRDYLLNNTTPDDAEQLLNAYFAPLYKPLSFATFGKFDVATLMLVDHFEIINRLSLLDYGTPQQFIYGAIPDFQNLPGDLQTTYKSHPQFSDNCMYSTIKNWRNSLPLIGICQFKINNFINIDGGLPFINQIMLKFFEHLPEVTGKVEMVNGKFIKHRNKSQIIAFYSLSWNEIVLLVFGDSYSEISQVIMDFRESFPSDLDTVSEKLGQLPEGLEFPRSLGRKIYYDTNKRCLSFKGVMSEEEKNTLLNLTQANQSEDYKEAIRVIFEKSQYYSQLSPGLTPLEENIIWRFTQNEPPKCQSHTFSTTYTVHGFDIDLQRKLYKFFGQITGKRSTSNSQQSQKKTETQNLLSLHFEKLDPQKKPWLKKLHDLKEPVLPLIFADCKPGHFSLVAATEDPNFHHNTPSLPRR